MKKNLSNDKNSNNNNSMPSMYGNMFVSHSVNSSHQSINSNLSNHTRKGAESRAAIPVPISLPLNTPNTLRYNSNNNNNNYTTTTKLHSTTT